MPTLFKEIHWQLFLIFFIDLFEREDMKGAGDGPSMMAQEKGQLLSPGSLTPHMRPVSRIELG